MAITVWVLISVATGYYSAGNAVNLGAFFSEQECKAVANDIAKHRRHDLNAFCYKVEKGFMR